MKEISNQTLAFLLVVAIIVSLGGTFLSLQALQSFKWGYPTITALAGTNFSTGFINVSVTDVTAMNVSTGALYFGEGRVASWSTNCSVDTLGNTNNASRLSGTDGVCLGINKLYEGFILYNIGNNNVTLNISFNTTANEFIGGDPMNDYMFRVFNGTKKGCIGSTNGSGIYPPSGKAGGGKTNTTDFAENLTQISSSENYTVCTVFRYTVDANMFNISINLTIPSDSLKGGRSSTISFYGITVP